MPPTTFDPQHCTRHYRPLPENDRIAYRYPDCRRERSVSTAASCTFRYPVLHRNASEYGIPYCNKDENILNRTIELP